MSSVHSPHRRRIACAPPASRLRCTDTSRRRHPRPRRPPHVPPAPLPRTAASPSSPTRAPTTPASTTKPTTTAAAPTRSSITCSSSNTPTKPSGSTNGAASSSASRSLVQRHAPDPLARLRLRQRRARPLRPRRRSAATSSAPTSAGSPTRRRSRHPDPRRRANWKTATGTFDVVTAIEVLEHVPDPREVLRADPPDAHARRAVLLHDRQRRPAPRQAREVGLRSARHPPQLL